MLNLRSSLVKGVSSRQRRGGVRQAFAAMAIAALTLAACGSLSTPDQQRSSNQMRVRTGAPEAQVSGPHTAATRFRQALLGRPIIQNLDFGPPSASLLSTGSAYLVVGTLDSLESGTVVDGPTISLQCEAKEGVPTEGTCSRTLRFQVAAVSATLESAFPRGAAPSPDRSRV